MRQDILYEIVKDIEDLLEVLEKGYITFEDELTDRTFFARLGKIKGKLEILNMGSSEETLKTW